jgi:uncharacterized membrane protein
LTAGLFSFVAACAVHYAGYQRFLDRGLREDDPTARRVALVGWARFAIGWQVIVMVVAGLWILSFALRHAHGYTWALPAIGLVLGTALPLQLVVMRISRANR